MAEQTAQNIARDACYWIKANPRDFRALMAIMHHQVDIGNPCTKQGEIESYARAMGMTIDVADVFSHNRTLYPALTRYMVMLRPRLAKTIRFRRSKLDEIDLEAIWREVVNASTTFLARDRFEAEKLVGMEDVSAA